MSSQAGAKPSGLIPSLSHFFISPRWPRSIHSLPFTLYPIIASILQSFTDAEQFLLSIGGLDDVKDDGGGFRGDRAEIDHFAIGYTICFGYAVVGRRFLTHIMKLDVWGCYFYCKTIPIYYLVAPLPVTCSGCCQCSPRLPPGCAAPA